MRDVQDVLARLQASKFRRRFRLGPKESDYLRRHGLGRVLDHADDLLRQRLGAAEPVNDGRQTPMRGHPVFVAQHATATCCRSCLQKWHGIAMHRPLSDDELAYMRRVLGAWLSQQPVAPSATTPSLFDTAVDEEER